jgi:hypothetical protein
VNPARLEREIRLTTDAALRAMARGKRDLARILCRRVAELIAMRGDATVRKMERERGLA